MNTYVCMGESYYDKNHKDIAKEKQMLPTIWRLYLYMIQSVLYQRFYCIKWEGGSNTGSFLTDNHYTLHSHLINATNHMCALEKKVTLLAGFYILGGGGELLSSFQITELPPQIF